MPKTLEFFFDFISPFSYVAHHALPRHLDGDLSRVTYRPMFLGAVMQATGNRPPGLVPAKGKYMSDDLRRCCERYGISFRMNPNFPMMNTRPVLRMACALSGDQEELRRFATTIFHHVWAAPQPLDTGDMEQLASILRSEGFDAEKILQSAEGEEAKDMMKTNTDEAIARGAFGAPSFFVGDNLFFGHDRLDYAVEALERAQA